MYTNQQLALQLVNKMLCFKGYLHLPNLPIAPCQGQVHHLKFTEDQASLAFTLADETGDPLGKIHFDICRVSAAPSATVTTTVTACHDSPEAHQVLRDFYFHSLFQLVSATPEHLWEVANASNHEALTAGLEEELRLARTILLEKLHASKEIVDFQKNLV